MPLLPQLPTDMTDAGPLTVELAERVERLLGEYAERGLPKHPQDLARQASQLGIGLVDAERNRSWIDETVYSRALHEAHYWRERAAAAERLCQARGFALELPAEAPKP